MSRLFKWLNSRKKSLITLLAVASYPLMPLCAGEFVELISVTDVDGNDVPVSYATADAPDPNNDNVVISPNSLQVGAIEFTQPGPIDFRVRVANTGGTTEYRLEFGTAENSTPQTWTGFRIIGGIGIGDDFLPISELDPGTLPTGLDWDTPDRDTPPTSPDFELLEHEDDLLVFGNGSVAPGEIASGRSFAGDIPDADNGPSYEFTIRLLPVADGPPTEDHCDVATTVLWPPNHGLVDVGLTVHAFDDCDPSPTLEVLVYADEDDELKKGDGRHSPDAILDDGVLRLRAERSGRGDGRVYLIVVVGTDCNGDEHFSCCTVVVPHSMNGAAISDVEEQAVSAALSCELGEVPPGFVPVGDGEILGPKQ